MLQDCRLPCKWTCCGCCGRSSDSGLLLSTLSPPPTPSQCTCLTKATAAKARPVSAVGALVVCSDVLRCWSYKPSHRGVNAWFAQLWGVISSFCPSFHGPWVFFSAAALGAGHPQSPALEARWARESARARSRHADGSGQGGDSTYHGEDEAWESAAAAGVQEPRPTGSSPECPGMQGPRRAERSCSGGPSPFTSLDNGALLLWPRFADSLIPVLSGCLLAADSSLPLGFAFQIPCSST